MPDSLQKKSEMVALLKGHSLPVQIEGFPYIVGGLVLAIASFLVFDSPSMSTWLGLSFIFGHWCVPLSIPIS